MIINVGYIDTGKLKRNVYDFIQNFKEVSYLIMNKNTFEELRREYENTSFNKIEEIDYYPKYCGIPIAICNKLDFGEIDIK